MCNPRGLSPSATWRRAAQVPPLRGLPPSARPFALIRWIHRAFTPPPSPFPRSLSCRLQRVIRRGDPTARIRQAGGGGRQTRSPGGRTSRLRIGPRRAERLLWQVGPQRRSGPTRPPGLRARTDRSLQLHVHESDLPACGPDRRRRTGPGPGHGTAMDRPRRVKRRGRAEGGRGAAFPCHMTHQHHTKEITCEAPSCPR